MKRIYTMLIVIFTIGQICYAQPYVSPVIYVSPYGSNDPSDYGVDVNGTDGFNIAITPDLLMTHLHDVNNPAYFGDVKICFMGGDYYTEFDFNYLLNTIQSLEIYGGFGSYEIFDDLTNRDFIFNETRFHAVGGATVKLCGLPYYGNNNIYTIIIDGITITSDYMVSDYALSLIQGNYIVSQCKIEGFQTDDILMWLESGGGSITFVSCLFADNVAYYLMALCTNVNLINVTIADNDLKDDMFIPFAHAYTYNMRNSIIYGNSNMDMASLSFDVYHSILENLESWVNDIGGNMFNTDPLFTYNYMAPYSCDYTSSPAIGAGEPAFITSLSFYALHHDILDYDVINFGRYYDSNPVTMLDIGAYQRGTNLSPYYNIAHPSEYENDPNECLTVEPIHIWSDAHAVHINNIKGANATLILYNTAGQMVYASSLSEGNNTISTLPQAGTYIVKTTSSEGEAYAKLIVK